MILEHGGPLGAEVLEEMRDWGLYKTLRENGRADFREQRHLFDLAHPKPSPDREYLWVGVGREILRDSYFFEKRYSKKSFGYRVLPFVLLTLMFALVGWASYGVSPSLLSLIAWMLATGLCLLFACMEIYIWRSLRKGVDRLNERSADSVPLSADTIDLIRLLAGSRDAEKVVRTVSNHISGLASFYCSEVYAFYYDYSIWYSIVHEFILDNQEFLDRLISREERYVRLIDEELYVRSRGRSEYFMSDELFFNLLMKLKSAVDREYEPVKQREIAERKARELEEAERQAKLKQEQKVGHQRSIQEAADRTARAKAILNSSESPAPDDSPES